MKMKVIAIAHLTPNLNVGDSEKISLVGGKFTRFNDNKQFWFFSLGNTMMDLYSSFLDFEIWQPETNIDRIYEKKFENGLIYKLIPGEFVNELTFSGYKKRLYSQQIINNLDIEVKQNKQSILFFRGTYEFLLQKIVSRFYKKVLLIGMFSINIAGELTNDEIVKNPFHEIYHYFFGVLPYRRFLKKVHNFVPSTQEDIRKIDLFKKLNVFYRADLASWGIDHHFWQRTRDKSEIRKKYNLLDDEKILLISSRIVPEKQVKEVINVLGNFSDKNFRLIVTGNLGTTPYVKETVESANKLLPGKVIFTGYVSDEELRDIYTITDLMISYSLSEGGPFSIFQAYLMEVPVIQSEVGTAGEIARKHSVSKLVNPDNSHELVTSIGDFFSGHIPETLDRRIAINYFDWEKIAEYYMNVFWSVKINFKNLNK